MFLYFCFRLANPEDRDMFGMVISYTVKVKLYLGAMGGEVTAELPFVLMHPKVSQSEALSGSHGRGSHC